MLEKGKMKINITITDEKGNVYEGNALLQKVKKGKQKRTVQTSAKRKLPSNVILDLYHEGFFSEEKKLSDVAKKLKQVGYNFGKSSVAMALKADYLKQKGTKGKFKFIQKYPP